VTFTVVARNEKDGKLGIALCTNPITVGNRCPFIRANVGAVSTQANTDPSLGPLAIELLSMGHSPKKVIHELAETDADFEYRQIGIVDRHGRVAVHTGKENVTPCGAISGPNYIVMGNYLSNNDVVPKMNQAWLDSAGKLFEDRLFLTLKAGRDAGGDAGGHRSASILTYDTEPFPSTDLRIDFVPKTDTGPDAIDQLGVLLERWRPLMPYYKEKPHIPTMANWQDWLKARGTPFQD